MVRCNDRVDRATIPSSPCLPWQGRHPGPARWDSSGTAAAAHRLWAIYIKSGSVTADATLWKVTSCAMSPVSPPIFRAMV
jgi:hypothetical protein